METTAHVPLPEITLEGGTPRSSPFDDVYFSHQGGIAETTHVFLQGNGLPARWQEKPCAGEAESRNGRGDATFTIAELGFGTGLNFLVTWQAWLQQSARGQLHYIAVEKFPLTLAMLRETLALQPELTVLAAQLLAQHPARLPGWHRLRLGEVTLTLGFGDAEALLAEITTHVDAWYLDGFSPAKNPDMWGNAIYAQMQRLSAPGSSFATFTAASAVRRGLEAAGFVIEKLPGFGRKREMSAGRFQGNQQPSLPKAACEKTAHDSPTTYLVVGGGIAGCSMARALAERGCAVTMLTGAVADGASGNARAVLFPQLSKRWLASTAWFMAGADFARRQLQQLQGDVGELLYASPGILRLPRHAQEEAALRCINGSLGLDETVVQWVGRDAACDLAGVALLTGAAYLPQGSWVNPARWCEILLQHNNITVHEKRAVNSLTRDGENWVAITDSGAQFAAQQIVLANAQNAAALLPMPLPFGITAGQVSAFDAGAFSLTPTMILCHKGYVIADDAHALIGATYDRDDLSCAVTEENHQRNMAEIDIFLPGWLSGKPHAGRTSMRMTTPDRMPYVGQLAAGLWVSIGHGSRGMVSAPLAAELIASQIFGEALPVSKELYRAVDPQRMFK